MLRRMPSPAAPTRRTLLSGATAATMGTALPASPAVAVPARRRSDSDLTLRWLGTSGWRIDVSGETTLVDPYLTRYPVGLSAGRFDATTRLRVDDEACRIAGVPARIFVTHTHWDHFNDVPHLAIEHGATAFGTLTAYQLGRSMGVPVAQLSPLKGGEQLDFGTYVVRVVPGLHSRTASHSLLFPGTLAQVPAPPAVIADLPEGDTLSFQIEVPRGPRVFLMGASDVDESQLPGLDPDVAAIAVPSTDATHDFVPRVIEALGRPRTVVPVHWDDFETPLQNPPRASDDMRHRLERFTDDVRRASPRSRVVVPAYNRPL